MEKIADRSNTTCPMKSTDNHIDSTRTERKCKAPAAVCNASHIQLADSSTNCHVGRIDGSHCVNYNGHTNTNTNIIDSKQDHPDYYYDYLNDQLLANNNNNNNAIASFTESSMGKLTIVDEEEDYDEEESSESDLVMNMPIVDSSAAKQANTHSNRHYAAQFKNIGKRNQVNIHLTPKQQITLERMKQAKQHSAHMDHIQNMQSIHYDSHYDQNGNDSHQNEQLDVDILFQDRNNSSSSYLCEPINPNISKSLADIHLSVSSSQPKLTKSNQTESFTAKATEEEESNKMKSSPTESKKKFKRLSLWKRLFIIGKTKTFDGDNIYEEFEEFRSRSVKVKYFKYNASYRKANRQKNRQSIASSNAFSYQLLQPILVGHDQQQLDELISKMYNQFGVQFSYRNGYFWKVSFGQQQSLTHCEDLTRNLALAFQTVALIELQADLNLITRSSSAAIQVSFPNFHSANNASSNNSGNNRKSFASLSSKGSDALIFGGNLTSLHVRDIERNKKDLEVPSILKYIVQYISKNGTKEEGIFRISGTKNRLIKLEEELTELFGTYYRNEKADDESEINGILERYSMHDVASILKLFLRRLSPPLITHELAKVFLMVPDIEMLYDQIKLLNLLMLILNDSHRNSLKCLLELLNQVVRNESVNKISLDGMATLIAANLFDILNSSGTLAKQTSSELRRKSLSSQSILGAMQEQLSRTQNWLSVFKLLINLQPILFHIPPYLERQRHQDKVKDQVKQFNI